ncbi:MAG: ComEC/Rec2 family competence protein, partial [Clostridia bacterium]|nr:ComEC/Rec2 family competence protein [Clostridia bacterium]
LLLGEKGDLSKELKRDFRTLGLSHLLAVSGLHLSVLFALWSFLLIRMRIPLKARCGLLIPLSLLFCALCGFSPSVLRACVMLILYLISKIVNEDSDSVTSLLFAGGLIVLFSPYAVFDVGFLLSFFSAFGILVTTPLHLEKKRKEGRIPRLFKSIANALLVSLFAQIATLPILCLTYGSFSLLSVPATLLFAPLISLILYLAPIALILSFIPGLSSLLFLLLEAICTVVIRLSSLAIYVKEGLVSTEHPLAIPLLGLLLCGVVYLLLAKKKRPAIALLAGCYLLFSSLCFLCPRFEKPLILADTYGKNDLFVLYDHGESLIVDLSDGSKGALERSLYLLFDNTLDQTPDALLLTHYHKRHVSSFRSLCQEYYPKRLYLCRPITEEEKTVFDELLLLAKQRSVAVTVIEKEQSLSFGRYTLSDFYREYLPRSTHPILSFTVNEGCHSFCYLSSSALEGSFYPEEQILYMGVHGPVIKKQLPGQLSKAFSLVFASQSLLEDYGYPHGLVNDRTDTSC